MFFENKSQQRKKVAPTMIEKRQKNGKQQKMKQKKQDGKQEK